MEHNHDVKSELSSKQTRHKNSFTKQTVTLPILLGIVLFTGVIAFTGGMKFGKDQAKVHNTPGLPISAGSIDSGNSFMGRGMRGDINGTIGDVTAVSTDSITVNSRRTNASATYSIDSNTKVLNDTTTASVSDIKVGDSVLVQASTSNTKLASRIVLNFSFGGPPNGSDGGGTNGSGSGTGSNSNI